MQQGARDNDRVSNAPPLLLTQTPTTGKESFIKGSEINGCSGVRAHTHQLRYLVIHEEK